MKLSTTFNILSIAVTGSLILIPTNCFVFQQTKRIPTNLHLEDHIADMIDGEVQRLSNKDKTEAEYILKRKQWERMEPTMPTNFDFETDLYQPINVPGFTSGVDRSVSSPRRRKDEKMAADNPMRYCADRCVSTGNCDVFEDMFNMDPREVVEFCSECVLSEDEEPCDIPESAFSGEEVDCIHRRRSHYVELSERRGEADELY